MDKSPGPDKVTACVLKDCLDVILGPLTDIINCSILTSSFPAKWKEAEVVPILKDGDHEVAANNRPISLLPIASKVCERIVLDQVNSYLTENKLLTSHQSGNKKSHSTDTVRSMSLIDNILEAMNDKKITVLVLLDLSKAFDSINHEKLLEKLSTVGAYLLLLNGSGAIYQTPATMSESIPLILTLYLLPMVFLKVQSCRHYCFAFT